MRKMLLVLACMMLGAPAWAQEADPNLRHPSIRSIPGEGPETGLIFGDTAWGDVLVSLAALRQLDPAQSAALAERLWARRDIDPPIFLFEVARLTAETDPEWSLEAYFLGRSRTIYDASRCIDPSARLVVDVASAQAGQAVHDLLATDLVRLEAALSSVIESGATYTSQASPWWACSFGDAAYAAADNDADMPGAEWLKVETVWPMIQGAITSSMIVNLGIVRQRLAAEE